MIALLASGILLLRCVQASLQRSPPNLLLIVLDTVRADAVSLTDDAALPTTPFLRGLAARGATFRQARAPANWTLPSHASLFTGLTPSEHGCHFEHRYLADECETIAEVLQRDGYATAAFSANVNVSRLFNLDQGFDRFAETWRDRSPSDRVCARFLEWLDERPARPWFAFLNLMDAHLPYDAAPGFEHAFGTAGAALDRDQLAAGDFLDRVLAGEVVLTEGFRRALAERYASAVRGLDHRLETLFQQLEGRAALAETVVIITSDHGENLGEHGLVDHHGPLHETLLRIPLVLVGPGIPPAVIDRPVGLTDVFRWLAELRQGTFHLGHTARPTLLLAERMRPVEVLERLARTRPDVDPGPLAARGLAAVSPALPWKLLRQEGRPDVLADLRAAAPDALDLADREPAARRRMQELVRDRLALTRPVQERLAPEPNAPAATAAEEEELRRLGYLAGPRRPGPSVHAQEHLNRGNRAYRVRDLAGARHEFAAAVALAPGFADARFNLALVLDESAPAAARAAWEAYLAAARRSGDQDEASLQHARRRLADRE